EGVTAAAEGRTVAADDRMLVDKEDAEPGACQQVRADQPADAGTDHDGVIRGIEPAGGADRCETAPHSHPLPSASSPRRPPAWPGSSGRFRPYCSCASTISPVAIAAPIDSSPASAVAAAISANRGAPPAPAQPSICRHSPLVPRCVPPPTVPTVSD